MKANNLLIGIGIGAAIGFVVAKALDQQLISSETALKHVKKIVLSSKEIDIDNIRGSWILTKVDQYVRNGLQYSVYNGGISGKHKELEKHYSFKIDANTGTILELAEE